MNAKRNPGLLVLIIVLLSGLVGLILSLEGINVEGVAMMIRATARTSMLLFSLAFAAASMHYLWKNNLTRSLLVNRRYLGLSFAYSHYLHLFGILYLQFFETQPLIEERGWVIVSLGGVAYVLLTLMAFTSTDEMIRKMGTQNWQRLHRIGSFYIWIVFATSYFPRALKEPFYIPFAVILVLAMTLRLVKYLKSSKAWTV